MDPVKVFIVEDEPIEAMDLASILERLGYAVTGNAMSGEECLEKVAADRPDLIIMDIKLQGEMDGVDTAWKLRKICDVPVIFTTALSDKSSLSRAKLTKPYGYIVKPFSERELYTTIETSLYRNRIDRRLRESEIKYRTLFEQSRDAIFICNDAGVITDVNSAMIVLTGYGAHDLTGMNVKELFVDDCREVPALREIQDRGFVENRETLIRKHDGTLTDVLLTSTRIVGVDTVDFGSQWIVRDIAGQKRLERIRDVLFYEKIKRVKELNCLYRIASISGNIETPLDDICRQIVEIVPTAFQNPGLISVLLRYRDREFTTHKFSPSGVSFSAPVGVFGEGEGNITVYIHTKPQAEEEAFTKEDRDLLNAVAERLGIIIERKKTFEDLALSREELRGLSAHLQSLREEERTEISREIHDVLGQSLTAIKMDISWIKKGLSGGSGQYERAEAAVKLIDGTIEVVRRISSELRPGLLDDLGLGAAIEWCAEEFQKRTGIACRVTSNMEDITIDEKRSINLYRIFQESLTNIIRHAKATAVYVSLDREPDALVLTVRDNGRGITEEDINSPSSLGLVGIRERVLSFGGTVSFDSAGERGTAMIARIPLGGAA